MNANESKTEEKYTLDVTEHVKWILSQAKEWAEENIEDVEASWMSCAATSRTC
jgi:hypothetical protein